MDNMTSSLFVALIFFLLGWSTTTVSPSPLKTNDVRQRTSLRTSQLPRLPFVDDGLASLFGTSNGSIYYVINPNDNHSESNRTVVHVDRPSLPVEDNLRTGEIELTSVEVTNVKTESDCDSCEQRTKSQERRLSDAEIRKIRIDEIKSQILRKLRMETRPNVTIHRSMLPQPLMEGEIALKGHMKPPTRNIEDFYGKKEQVIVMAENDAAFDAPYCQTKHHDPAGCFYFKLTNDITYGYIESSELWVYKMRDRRDRLNQTYVVTEFTRDSQNVTTRKSIVAISETDIKNGWMKIDLTATIMRWLLKPRLGVYGLEISCKTCSMSVDDIPVSYDPGEKPFIVINMKSEDILHRRQRSSMDCSENTSQCCRESLYINFNEIGWSDWIVQPAGYYANYCKGSCVEDVTIPLGKNHHTTIMQQYVKKKTGLSAEEKKAFSPCCTPTRMSSTSLIYQDTNNNIVQNNLPNMAVESCGCY